MLGSNPLQSTSTRKRRRRKEVNNCYWPKKQAAQLWTHFASGLSHPSVALHRRRDEKMFANGICFCKHSFFAAFLCLKFTLRASAREETFLAIWFRHRHHLDVVQTHIWERWSKINAFNRKLFLLFSALRGRRARFVRFHATHHSLITFHNNLSVIIIVFVVVGVWRRKTFACGAFGTGRGGKHGKSFLSNANIHVSIVCLHIHHEKNGACAQTARFVMKTEINIFVRSCHFTMRIHFSRRPSTFRCESATLGAFESRLSFAFFVWPLQLCLVHFFAIIINFADVERRRGTRKKRNGARPFSILRFHNFFTARWSPHRISSNSYHRFRVWDGPIGNPKVWSSR